MSVRADNVPFNWKDPFMLEEQLSEEERLVRHTAKQYAQENYCLAFAKPIKKKKLTQKYSVKWAHLACLDLLLKAMAVLA